eukprot:scaffold430_cov187-Alexandrium_tamarense.AAC.19
MFNPLPLLCADVCCSRSCQCLNLPNFPPAASGSAQVKTSTINQLPPDLEPRLRLKIESLLEEEVSVANCPIPECVWVRPNAFGRETSLGRNRLIAK